MCISNKGHIEIVLDVIHLSKATPVTEGEETLRRSSLFGICKSGIILCIYVGVYNHYLSMHYSVSFEMQKTADKLII